MPDRRIVDAFVAEVEAGRYVEAIEAYYAEAASMQENNDPPRVGRDLLMAAEKQVMASASITGKSVGPVFVDGDHVVIRWQFAFTPRGGETRTLDEIAWQRWDGDKVVEERFFYDPKQMGR
jgi:hypothetical protein